VVESPVGLCDASVTGFGTQAGHVREMGLKAQAWRSSLLLMSSAGKYVLPVRGVQLLSALALESA